MRFFSAIDYCWLPWTLFFEFTISSGSCFWEKGKFFRLVQSFGLCRALKKTRYHHEKSFSHSSGSQYFLILLFFQFLARQGSSWICFGWRRQWFLAFHATGQRILWLLPPRMGMLVFSRLIRALCWWMGQARSNGALASFFYSMFT